MNSSPSSLQNNNVWFAVAVGLMGLIVGYSIAVFGTGISGGKTIGANNNAPSAPSVPAVPGNAAPPAALADVPPVDSKTDYILGPSSAKVTFIEYIDYECPFCKRHHDTMLALRKMYPNDVNFVIRQFPLSFHQNAQKESEAAECVGSLGGSKAFWQFSDLILDKTQSGGTGFDLKGLPDLAKQSGVDVTKFNACLDSGKFAQKILDEQNAGQAAGVNGTPGNVIMNNTTSETRLIAGAVPLTTITQVIDSMLGKTK